MKINKICFRAWNSLKLKQLLLNFHKKSLGHRLNDLGKYTAANN
ncbi:hypothetical protein LAC1533_1255 [Ligilactobacillus acidipiscis]|uniref:Uncharacterized protein n=1 Tax=Ligilactobacillus acidipiscis TaxID=89059 RepID=A0A1K1KP91_9LACO|nr:hypothetical protein LAC1533_1255 [Ligilactobacillus acidipiscis]